jgi:hypothetical protein
MEVRLSHYLFSRKRLTPTSDGDAGSMALSLGYVRQIGRRVGGAV